MIWNEGTLSDHRLFQKSCHGLGFHSSNRYESDLSNEVLYTLVGQKAAKISESKLEVDKKLPTQPDSRPLKVAVQEDTEDGPNIIGFYQIHHQVSILNQSLVCGAMSTF